MHFHDNKPIYLQIADFICEQILTQQLKPDERVASIREMAISLEVNPNTVMRTYAFLEEQAIIARRRGVGYFVVENAYKTTLNLKRQEFLDTDLPRLFKMLDLLDIDLNELNQLYQRRKRHEKKQ